jgi:CheY-like chemotaxis protein
MTVGRAVKSKILIVEDDGMIRYSYADLLQKEGYEVIEAADGRAGLERALLEKPDVILLDLLMPEMGGQILLQELRKDSWGKSAKVIILTNIDKPRPIFDTLVQNHAENYLIKANTTMKQIVLYVQLALS